MNSRYPLTRQHLFPAIREKSLIRLKDQLGPFRIPAKDIQGYGKTRHADIVVANFLDANKQSLAALDIFSSISFERNGPCLELRTNGIIGAVPLISSETRKIAGGIIVEPKFGWGDIGPLLSSIGWAASPQLLNLPMVPGSAREIPPWVLAGPMIEKITALLRDINSVFTLAQETREMPRGKIVWSEYISHSLPSGRPNKIPCIFPELNENNILRSYIKWGLENIKISLLKVGANDVTSNTLLSKIDFLLWFVKDVLPKVPTKGALESMVTSNRTADLTFINGITALSWIREERGLAGRREPDGLSWRIEMNELFERWIESIVRYWATTFGGRVSTGRQSSSRTSIHWSNSALKSLSSLLPDVTIETMDTVYIFDAKYKKLYEELDDQKWRELSKELQEDHRHDIHQVLAYASLYNKKRIVSVLAYPLTDVTYTSLSKRSRLLNRAYIPIENKTLELAIIGVPLSVDRQQGLKEITSQLDPLKIPLLGY